MSRIITILAIALTFLPLNSCGQNSSERYQGYTDLEIETEVCLNRMFKEKGDNFKELKTIFENYFSSGQISNSNDKPEKQYQDILNFWEQPTKRFPLFNDKEKVVAIREKLGLTEKDILSKKQLDCFTNKYVENSARVNKPTSYYAFGATLEEVREVPDISPGLIAGAINMTMNKEDLKKELYQNTIVLMFCFDMTLYLTDGEK